jgi:O-antigen/teichoic acid export membrane protein
VRNNYSKLQSWLGLSSSVSVSLGAKIWQAASSALTIILIAHLFSKEQQGYFYTFSSVLGLQVVFEMGLSFVIFQHAGHLFSQLNWLSDGDVAGDHSARLRFFLLLRSAFTWYFFAAVALLIFLLPAGILFFHNKYGLSPDVWLWPWITLVIITSLNLIIIPVLSAIEGSGKVIEVNQLRLVQGLIGSGLAWLLLFCGFGLWMVVSLPLVSLICSVFWLRKYYSPSIKTLISVKRVITEDRFSWKAEVWPMQWKIAVSWISGYFIFQLFTPILFHFHGPVLAGKMGMSLSLATMVNSFGFVLLQANGPILTKLAARKSWIEFDHQFFRFFKQSLYLVFFGYSMIVVFIYLFKGLPIIQRLVEFRVILILFSGFLISHVISMLAYYMRLHKKEPFMILSIVGAVLLSIGIFFSGRIYADLGMAISFLLVNLIYGLPSSLWLWHKFRKEWHSNEAIIDL